MAAGGVLCSNCMHALTQQSGGDNFPPTPPSSGVQPVPVPVSPPSQISPPPASGVYPTPVVQVDYRIARTKGETRVLLITLILLFLLFIFGAMATANGQLDAVLGYVLLALGVTAFYLFLIRLVQRQFLGNALRVERGHFSNLKVITGQIAALLRMAEPEVYIFQDPYLNAFSMGFKRPYTIALHSAIVEYLDQEELTAVLVHEVGHIWFGHTRISAYVTPVVFQIPIVSPVMEYIFGFWARRTELSCDRLALLVTRNPRAVIEGLVKGHVGPHFLQQLDAEGVLFQEHQTRGFLNKLAQSISTHPFMTTRIKRLLEYARELGLVYVDKNGLLVCEICGLKSQPSSAFCTRCNAQLYRPV
ncbi:MAG: hypothetical protein A2113_00290 [Candidatus Woykebacteria bacterium GWA1_44_8]|nr:MAG: hypothetical protein A2113_00290 [Candidatus Woykebacteria bacterium GWA1_44_8]